jgi:hypothetical protein
MGVKCVLDMPRHRREGYSVYGKKHDQLYRQRKQLVEGQKVDI